MSTHQHRRCINNGCQRPQHNCEDFPGRCRLNDEVSAPAEAPLLQDADRALSKALAATPEAYRRPQSHENPDADKKPSAGAVLQSHGDAPAVPAAPVSASVERVTQPQKGLLSRADAITIARYIAAVYGRQDDAPDYLPRTVEQAATFEPHGWVVMALMQAYTEGSADGYSAGIDFMRATAPTAGATAAPAAPAAPDGLPEWPFEVNESSTALERFIHDNEPADTQGTQEFRAGLMAVLREAAAAPAAPVQALTPLSHEQIADMLQDHARDSKEMHDFARAVEAAHGIKAADKGGA